MKKERQTQKERVIETDRERESVEAEKRETRWRHDEGMG